MRPPFITRFAPLVGCALLVAPTGCGKKRSKRVKPSPLAETNDGKENALAQPPERVEPARAPVEAGTAFADEQGRWRSGTRLSAIVHDAGGGATRFSSWWDRKLRTRCEMVATKQGMACLPLVESPTGLFSDAECTQPVHAVVDEGCADVARGTLMRRRVTDPCGFRFSGARVVSEPHPSKTWAKNLTTGQCVGGGSREISVVELEFVPLDAFVSAEQERVATEGGLESVMLRSPDGARQRHGVALEGGASCHEHGFEPARHCVPEDSLFVSEVEFVDDACEQRGAVWYPPVPEGCEAPSKPIVATLATNVKPANCYRHEIHEVVRELKSSEVFSKQRSECGSTSTKGRFFLAGDLIDDDRLPRLDDVTLGDGRVRHQATKERGQTTPLTELERWQGPWRGHWIDGDGDYDCVPRRTADGQLRCFPERSQDLGDRVFADQACTEPLALVREDPCNEPGPELHAIVRRTGGCDPRVYAAYEAKVYEGSVYLRGRRDACQLRERSPGEIYYTPGEVMPLDSFVPVEELLGPAEPPTQATSGTGTGTGTGTG